MDLEEVKAIQKKFVQGVEKLKKLKTCLSEICSREGIKVETGAIETRDGVFSFWFAGSRYYVKIRISDRALEDIGTAQKVPLGWLDWGRYNESGSRETGLYTNFFDDKGLLCEAEKEEFYCDLADCSKEKLRRGMLAILQKLVDRTITVNNTVSL